MSWVLVSRQMGKSAYIRRRGGEGRCVTSSFSSIIYMFLMIIRGHHLVLGEGEHKLGIPMSGPDRMVDDSTNRLSPRPYECACRDEINFEELCICDEVSMKGLTVDAARCGRRSIEAEWQRQGKVVVDTFILLYSASTNIKVIFQRVEDGDTPSATCIPGEELTKCTAVIYLLSFL